MAINIQLRSESGKTIDDAGVVEWGELPAYDDHQYPYLRLIDPYGDTIFSSYQMVAVVPELERWAVERPSANVELVLQVARRCSGEIHTYVWLVGD